MNTPIKFSIAVLALLVAGCVNQKKQQPVETKMRLPEQKVKLKL